MTQGRRKGVKRRRKATRLLWSTGPKSRSQIKERAQENTVEQSEHMIRAMLRENFQVINTQGYVWCYVPVFLACWCWDRWAMGLPVLQREFKNIRETWRHPVSKQQQYPDSSVWRRQKDGKTFWKAVNNVCVYVCAYACVYCPCTHVCYLCMSACVCVCIFPEADMRVRSLINCSEDLPWFAGCSPTIVWVNQELFFLESEWCHSES